MWPFTSTYPEATCSSIRTEYDYIIVGGGTAGCALANRLSSDSSISVIVVEAGKVADTWTSRVPIISANFMADRPDKYERVSVPQPNLGGRELHLITGKAIGGSTRLNAMLYTRGSAAEYNAMSAAGRKGWSFDDVCPIFKSAECFFDKKVGSERGQNGEWTVRTHEIMYFASTQRFTEATQKVGLPYIDDVNSSSSPAFGIAKCQYTMDKNAHRNSTYTAFLPGKLAKSRNSHLTICTDTIVTKVSVKPRPDGALRAEGVHLRSAGRKSISAYVAAKREVILCAGPLANPQILQISGIGPRALLEEHGISVMKDLPGVGMHLQDHQACPISFQVPMKDSILSLMKNPLTAIKELLRYLTRGEGLFLLPIQEVLVFAKSSLIDGEGNIHATPSQLDASLPENIPDIELIPLAYEGGDDPPDDTSKGVYSINNALIAPMSRGTIRITSSDPDVPAEIDLNFLSHPDDFKVLRAGLRMSLAIVAEMRKAGYDITPTRVPASNSDEDMDAFIRRRTRSLYHFASTCRMAPEDDADSPGVVDDELRVHGVRGLRIADSSIFPQVPAAHTQAPSVMVGMKCAEMIAATWK